jgi:predicted DNA-binding protein (MmcQ/YjbR family)
MGNAVMKKIRERAMALPEAEQAWLFGDHEVIRVNKKVFVWVRDDEDDGSFGIGVKLRDTQALALTLPFASPMEYGMAKWGWVNARFEKREKPPLDLLLAWVDESYRNVAPKKRVAEMDGGAKAAAVRKKERPARGTVKRGAKRVRRHLEKR